MRLDKYPGIFDITDAGPDGVQVECASCKKVISRHKHTIERMMAIDGFPACSTSCRNAGLKPPGTPCS